MIVDPVSQEQLREWLSRINRRAKLHRQPRLVEWMRSKRPHAIRIVQQIRIDADRTTWNFNCHAYAFGLHTWEGFFPLVLSGADVWPDSRFVSELLVPVMQEKPREEATDGDIVVYSKGDASVVHSGRIQANLVVSKWGGYAHVWEHGLFELPRAFGSLDRYYAPPSRALVVDGFIHWAWQQIERRGDSSQGQVAETTR